MAAWLQSQVLLESVTLRLTLSTALIEANMKAKKNLIDDADVPAAVKNDLLADFQTKTGFLNYLWAVVPWETSELSESRDQRLALLIAEDHLRAALERKKNWNPAQIYLAQVLQAEAMFDEAERYLDSVIGISKPEPNVPADKTDIQGDHSKRDSNAEGQTNLGK